MDVIIGVAAVNKTAASQPYGLVGKVQVLAFSFVLTLAAGLAVAWMLMTYHQRQSDSLRVETVEKLGRIRADVESLLSGSLALTQGMATTLYAHGKLTDQEFNATAAQLIGQRPEIRNLGVAYGTVLRQVYPLRGNEKALGLDYRLHPQQWNAVESAITNGATVVDGPLNLVQGGVGVISRTPVFRPTSVGGKPEYFALVSLVIDIGTVLDRAGFNDPDISLTLALEANGALFHGDASILEQAPINAEIKFPGGSWRVYALPATGWPQAWWRFDPWLSLIGLALVAAVTATSLVAAMAWHHRTHLVSSLRESESRYRNLLDTAPAAIVLHRGGRLIFANKEAVRLLAAQSAADLIDRPMLDCIHPDYHSVVSDRVGSLRQIGDEVPPLRMKLITLDGGVVDADIASSAVLVSGKLAVLAIAVDATRTVRAETQRQAVLDDLQRSNDELRQFTAAASHDLQEPLRQIATYVQMLERRYAPLLDQDGHDFINFTVEGVVRMRRLLHDLGLYAQVQGAGAPFKRLELVSILAKVRATHQDRITRLSAHISDHNLPAVMADETQVEQLFENLIDNALRYSRSAVPPVITVFAQRQGAFWRIGVSDNGIGIDGQYQATIFDAFTRLHGPSLTAGSGLGLAICRRIVERHGGQIWVESEPDRGSTFYFTLPTA